MCPDRKGGAVGQCRKGPKEPWRDPAPTEGPSIRPRAGGPPDRRLPDWNPPPGTGPRRLGRLPGSLPPSPSMATGGRKSRCRHRTPPGRVLPPILNGPRRPSAGRTWPTRRLAGRVGRLVVEPCPVRSIRRALDGSPVLTSAWLSKNGWRGAGTRWAVDPGPGPACPGPGTAGSLPGKPSSGRILPGGRGADPPPPEDPSALGSGRPASRSKQQRPRVAPGPSNGRVP